MPKQSDALLIPDDLLEKCGEYYNSEFVSEHMPWIRALPFHVWLEKYLEKREVEIKARLKKWSLSA